MSVSSRSRRHIDRRVRDTWAAVSLVFNRADAIVLFSTISLGYLAVYLWAAQDLSLRTDMPGGIVVVSDPSGAMLRRTGPASFDAIAILDTGVIRWLVSPINLGIGLLLAMLVGISLALTYLAVVQPQSCGIGAGSGLLASFPALLSGSVCCGPVVLIALGIQASGLLMTAFVWLLPIGVLLLVGSTVYLASKIDVTPHSSVV